MKTLVGLYGTALEAPRAWYQIIAFHGTRRRRCPVILFEFEFEFEVLLVICIVPTIARLGNASRPFCIPCARAHEPALPITAHADPLNVAWQDSCASAPAWAAISINHATLRPAVHIMHPLRHLAIHNDTSSPLQAGHSISP